MKPLVTLRQALEDPQLLGASLAGPTWHAWRSLLLAAMGEPLQPDEHGVNYEPSEKPESELYRDLLPLLNSCAVDLLEHDKLATQLISLERRTSRGGKDSIDHAPGAHDDVANAVAGALVTAFSGSSYSAAQRAKDNETIATAYKRYARAWP